MQASIRNLFATAAADSVLTCVHTAKRRLNFRQSPDFPLHVRDREITRDALESLCSLVIGTALGEKFAAALLDPRLELIALGSQQGTKLVRAGLSFFQCRHVIARFLDAISCAEFGLGLERPAWAP